MLNLDKPIGPLRGLQIYRDHADLNQFYYVPERPRLALNDGVPEFVFLKYARDITDNPAFSEDQKASLGGGLLAFTVDLSVDEDILESIKGDLSDYARDGTVSLSPIMFEDGSVRLTITKQEEDTQGVTSTGGMKIFEETWGATKPSLYGNNRATFGVALSQEGATLMEVALKQGIGFVGVVYDLKFLGMRPSFNVKVSAEYKRIYNHFEAELGAKGTVQAVTFGADLGFGYQKLEDEGAIKVEVTTFTDNEDLKRQAEEAVKWARAKITEDLFKSSLKPPGFMTAKKDPVSALLGAFSNQLGGSIGSIRPNPRRTAPAARTTSGGTTSGGTTSGGTSSGGTTSGGTTSNNTSGGSSSSGLGVAATPSAPRGNHVDNPRSQEAASEGAEGGSGMSSIMPFKVALSLKYYRQEELKKRVFEFSRQSAELRSAAPQGLFTTLIEGYDLSDRIISVNLDDDMFKRLISDVGVVCDWENDGVELVNISTEYPGKLEEGEPPSHVDGYVFSQIENQRKQFMTWLNQDKDMSFRYKADVHFKSSSPWVGKDAVLHGDWETTRARQLVFNPLDEIGLLTVNIAADSTIDFNEVNQVIVQTQYEDPENDFRIAHSFLLSQDHKSDVWKLRLSNPYLKTIRWRAIYSMPDNIETTTDWVTTDENSIIVGEPFTGLRRIRLVPAVKAADILEAVVDISYEGPSGYRKTFQEVFTPDNLRGRTITINTLINDPASYRYMITIVRSDGSFYSSDEIESELPVIVVDDKEGEVQRLDIKLLADAALWPSLWAVEVQVRNAGAVDSLIFTESQPMDRVQMIGLAEGQALEYEWRYIQYKRDGTRTESEFQTELDPNLVISLT